MAEKPKTYFILVLFRAVALLAIMVTLAGFFGRVAWPFELASHFRFQCCWFLLLSGIVFVVVRQWRFAGVTAILGAACLPSILPAYTSAKALPHGKEPTLRVLTLNVLTHNRDYKEVLALIDRVKPDVAFLCEVDAFWVDACKSLEDEFLHHETLARNDNFGVAVYSRREFTSLEVVTLAETSAPTIVARVRDGDRTVSIIGTHTYPPVGSRGSRLRNDQLTHLAKIAAKEKSQPTMMVGDLNITPWSPYFVDLLRDSGLEDSRQGLGNQPTWSRFGIGLPIDHCLVREVNVHRRWVERVAGSDHDAVLVDVSLKQP